MAVPQWKSSGIDVARAHNFGVCISIGFVKKKKLQRSIVSSPHSNLKVDCERLLMFHWRKRQIGGATSGSTDRIKGNVVRLAVGVVDVCSHAGGVSLVARGLCAPLSGHFTSEYPPLACCRNRDYGPRGDARGPSKLQFWFGLIPV